MELYEANKILRTVKAALYADGYKLNSAVETDALVMLLDRLDTDKYLAPKIKHARTLSADSASRKRDAAVISFFRAIATVKNGIQSPVTSLSVMMLNKSVFGDLDANAGKPRAKNILTDGNAHTDPKYITGSLKSIISKMNDIESAPAISKEDFAGYLSHYMRELIILHPFDNGSDFTARLFMILFGKLKGFSLCYYRSPASVIKEAENAALAADDVTPLYKLFLNCLSYERTVAEQNGASPPPKTQRELGKNLPHPVRRRAEQPKPSTASSVYNKSSEDRLKRAIRLQQKISKLNEQLTELIQPLEKQSDGNNTTTIDKGK